jgi:ABC-type oligopeptide transport system substrate-binding subunit
MPYGTKAAGADPAKALAVRQAVANLVDRQAIADQVYKGTYLPLYSNVPSGFLGANESSRTPTATPESQAWTRPRRSSRMPESPNPLR